MNEESTTENSKIPKRFSTSRIPKPPKRYSTQKHTTGSESTTKQRYYEESYSKLQVGCHNEDIDQCKQIEYQENQKPDLPESLSFRMSNVNSNRTKKGKNVQHSEAISNCRSGSHQSLSKGSATSKNSQNSSLPRKYGQNNVRNSEVTSCFKVPVRKVLVPATKEELLSRSSRPKASSYKQLHNEGPQQCNSSSLKHKKSIINNEIRNRHNLSKSLNNDAQEERVFHIKNCNNKCDILVLGENDQSLICGNKNAFKCNKQRGGLVSASMSEFLELEKASEQCTPQVESFPVVDEDPEEFFTPENNKVTEDEKENTEFSKSVLYFDEQLDENEIDYEIQHLSLDLDIGLQKEMSASSYPTDQLQNYIGVVQTESSSSVKSRSKISVCSHPLNDLRQSQDSEDFIQDARQTTLHKEHLSPISKMLQDNVHQNQKEQNWLQQYDEQEWW